MKTFNSTRYIILACAAFFAGLSQVSALDTTVKVMIRQMQVDADGNTTDSNGNPTGVSVDKYFGEIDLLEGNQLKEGSFTALIEIGEYGSMFYLYVESLTTGALEELAVKFVSPYESPIATAEIKLTSEDDYSPVRTRSDEAFTLEIITHNEVWKSDLADGITPEISWNPFTVKVTPSYSIKNDSNIVTGTVEQTEVYLNSGNSGSNAYTTDDRLTEIPSPEIELLRKEFNIRGIETFEIEGVSQKDSSGNDVYKPIDKVSIDVWPKAEGKFIGISSGDTFTKSMPNVTAEVWSLYPQSTTYVEIFKLHGAVYTTYAQPDVANKLTYPASSSIPHGTEALPDRIILTNWDSQIKNNGTYALKVFTVTPFNNGAPELIMEVDGLVVDRKITFKGSIINSESKDSE